jgi:hypothetical protein
VEALSAASADGVITHVDVDETVWPVDVSSDDEDSAQWVQRYGTPERIVEQRYSVASVLGAYSHLCDPRMTLKDATAALRRARKAHVNAG